MSKAFKGLMLPADFKAQACGHVFRASHCKVCPHCYGMRAPALTAVVVRLPRRKASDPVEKAAKALQTALGGRFTAKDCRAAILQILNAHKEAA
jgi:hypothetical protein